MRLLFLKPNFYLRCQKISWFSILQTLLPSKQFGIHLLDMDLLREGRSWLARLKAVCVSSHICVICASHACPEVSITWLSSAYYNALPPQSIPFPVRSGQWRWRRAWGLGSNQRIYTRSSFQSSGLTNRLHLLAVHRTGQLHWLFLRRILFYTPCEWVIHHCHAGSIPVPEHLLSGSSWSVAGAVMPNKAWMVPVFFPAKAVTQFEYSSNRAEKDSSAHNAKWCLCLSWHFESVRSTGCFCTGRPRGFVSCSQNTTTISSLTSHLTNLTEIQFCLCLIWIKLFTVTHRSSVSYEATARWPH